MRAGVERILQVESGTFKYYLKIVPTHYVGLHGECCVARCCSRC